MAATSGMVSKLAIAAEPLDSGPGGIVGTLDPLHDRSGGSGGGEGIEGGFKLKGYGGSSPPATGAAHDAASVAPGWMKPPPPIKVSPHLQQHLANEEGAGIGGAAADADAGDGADGAADAPSEPYVVLSSSHAAPKLRSQFAVPAEAAAPGLDADGEGDGEGDVEPEVVAVQPMQWAKVRQPILGEQARHPAAAVAAPEPEPEPEVEEEKGAAGGGGNEEEEDAAAAQQPAAAAAPQLKQQYAWQQAAEEPEEEAEVTAAAAAPAKWQPPARKAANPLGGSKGSLMAPANPDAEVVRASDVMEEVRARAVVGRWGRERRGRRRPRARARVPPTAHPPPPAHGHPPVPPPRTGRRAPPQVRSPPIRVADLSKHLKEHFEHGVPFGGGLNGMHARDTVSAPGTSTPSAPRVQGCTLTQHDLVNTANVALVGGALSTRARAPRPPAAQDAAAAATGPWPPSSPPTGPPAPPAPAPPHPSIPRCCRRASSG
jgi:hypothetical protein